MYTILIVDDDSDQLEVMSTTISSFGYAILTASSRKGALLLLSTSHVDVVITDFALGDGTGADIIAEMGTRIPQIMTILYSGRVKRPAAVGQGLFDDYLIKPVDPGMLEQTIASCLEVRDQRQAEAEKGERAA